jgi:hypothetical protein
MNDFDFEELDKAVSDLEVKTHDEHGDSGSEPVVVSTPAAVGPVRKPLQPEVRPEPPRDAAQSTEAATTIPVATPQKRPTRLSDTRPRNRGAFMDIMPPNSRKSSGHSGVSIQPVSKPEDVVPEESKKPEPEMSAPVVTPAPEFTGTPKLEVPTSQPDTPKSTTEKATDEVSWPDPLEFGIDQKEKSEETPSTPFLAEAKVEKRPLGAFSNFKPVTPEPKVEEAPALETPKPQDELTPEKDGTFKEPELEAPKLEKEEPKPEAPEPSEKPDEPTEPEKPDLHGKAMLSIPQQYHIEAKPTDKATRPIFDTKEYHPPLVEDAGHEHRGGGSMWGKIFIAFVVVVLLAVAGYFAYIYFVQ